MGKLIKLIAALAALIILLALTSCIKGEEPYAKIRTYDEINDAIRLVLNNEDAEGLNYDLQPESDDDLKYYFSVKQKDFDKLSKEQRKAILSQIGLSFIETEQRLEVTILSDTNVIRTASPTYMRTPAPTSSGKDHSRPTDIEVFSWIQTRYVYYDRKYNSGKDAGEKYTEQVFKDAAEYFKLSADAIDDLYFSGSTNYYKR